MHDSILTYFWPEEQVWLDLFLGLSPLSPRPAILQAQSTIITNRSPALACFFAADIGYQPYLMQQVVIDSNDPQYATMFAATVPNADVKRLQDIVLKSNDLTWIVRFAFYVPTANKPALQKAVIKSANPKAAYDFLKHIPANPNAFKSILIASRKPLYLLELAKRTKSSKLRKQIEDILVKDKAVRACRLLIQVPNTNRKRLQSVVMASGDVKEIKLLAKDKDSQAAGLKVLF